MKKFFIFILPLINIIKSQETDNILKGTMISSEENSNLIKYAFDGNIKTQFMTNDENGWVGLKLREKNIITKIEWGQKEDDHNNYLLGVFEVSNSKTFEDAIPLHMIKAIGKIGEINSVKINFKKRFQYFRYVGPQGKYCKIYMDMKAQNQIVSIISQLISPFLLYILIQALSQKIKMIYCLAIFI